MGILIHPAPLTTIVMSRKVGAAVPPFGGWELGPHLPTKWHLDPSNRLTIIHQRHRHDRQTDIQRSDSIGRTVFSRQFVKRFPCKTVPCMLSDRCLSVCPVCPLCDFGVLWPNGWMDEDETCHAGRPRSRPYCIRLGSSSPSPKGAQHPLNFRSISVFAKRLDGLRCHLGYGGRSRLRRHCIRWGRPQKGGGTTPPILAHAL